MVVRKKTHDTLATKDQEIAAGLVLSNALARASETRRVWLVWYPLHPMRIYVFHRLGWQDHKAA